MADINTRSTDKNAHLQRKNSYPRQHSHGVKIVSHAFRVNKNCSDCAFLVALIVWQFRVILGQNIES